MDKLSKLAGIAASIMQVLAFGAFGYVLLNGIPNDDRGLDNRQTEPFSIEQLAEQSTSEDFQDFFSDGLNSLGRLDSDKDGIADVFDNDDDNDGIIDDNDNDDDGDGVDDLQDPSTALLAALRSDDLAETGDEIDNLPTNVTPAPPQTPAGTVGVITDDGVVDARINGGALNVQLVLFTGSGLEKTAGGLSLNTNCASGQVLKWDGSAWQCSADQTGITYTAGSGVVIGNGVISTIVSASDIASAGGTLNTDTDVSANAWVIDEDDFGSDSDSRVPTQQSVKAYVDDAIAAASSSISSVQANNLIANGDGAFGTNYNFNGSGTNNRALIFNSTDVPPGASGSFEWQRSTANTWIYGSELIPVDTSKVYIGSVTIKPTVKSANTGEYFGVAGYDFDGEQIFPYHHMYRGKTVTLTRDFDPSVDTKMYVDVDPEWDLSFNDVSLHYRMGVIGWDYQTSDGTQHPARTYSRNFVFGTFNTGSDFTFNGTDWEIPTKAPTRYGLTAGTVMAAGTQINQTDSGGSAKYMVVNQKPPLNEWTTYTGVIGGVDTSGRNVYSNFPPGTVYVRPMLLPAYRGEAGDITRFANMMLYPDDALGLSYIAYGEDQGQRALIIRP